MTHPFSTKRGISLPLEAFIGFVLAVMAMLAVVYAAARLGALFIPSSIDPATEGNVKTLARTIIQVGSSTKENDVVRHMPLYVGEDYIVVAFPRGVDAIIDECYSRFPLLNGPEKIVKPLSCGSDACLCLYKNKWGYDDFEQAQPLKPCTPLPGLDMVYSPYYLDEESRQATSMVPSVLTANLVGSPAAPQPPAYGGWTGQYQYFILYGGDCLQNGPLGVQEFYIDRIGTENRKVFIAGESVTTQNRYNDAHLQLPGYPHSLDTSLNELLVIINTSKDQFKTRDAVVTILTNPALTDRFIAASSQETFRATLFQRYKKNPVPIPSITETRVRNNALRIWEDYSTVLMKIGIPYLGKDHYAQTCVTAFLSARVENDCWVPRHIDLNA